MKTGNVIQEKNFAFALEIIALCQQMVQRRDFLAKMTIASKEARATCCWLRLLRASRLVELKVGAHLLHAEELVRRLTAIVKTTGMSPTLADVSNSKSKIRN